MGPAPGQEARQGEEDIRREASDRLQRPPVIAVEVEVGRPRHPQRPRGPGVELVDLGEADVGTDERVPAPHPSPAEDPLGDRLLGELVGRGRQPQDALAGRPGAVVADEPVAAEPRERLGLQDVAVVLPARGRETAEDLDG